MTFYLLLVAGFLMGIYVMRKSDEADEKMDVLRPLETERLKLRAWKISDAEDLYDYAQSDLVGPSAGWSPHEDLESSKKIIKMFIEEADVYAIELKKNSKVIGSIGLHERYPKDGEQEGKQKEIGFVLSPMYWGNGYMPEAVEAVKGYALQQLDVDIIWCGHFKENMKSKRVIEKTGFVYDFDKEVTLPRLNDIEVTTKFYRIDQD